MYQPQYQQIAPYTAIFNLPNNSQLAPYQFQYHQGYPPVYNCPGNSQSVIYAPEMVPEENLSEDCSEEKILVQTNGRKVYGPPPDWVGPPPNSSCELYIRRIPKGFDERKLLPPFERFGKIYMFRVPIDFVQGLRGYAYVRYTNPEDAGRAMEVLNHYFVDVKKTLDIVISCEKCRLFVSNIPKHLSTAQIEEQLRIVFPTMQNIQTKFPVKPNECNTGFVFINFASHNEALEAKKATCPGIIRLWDQDLKVVWAHNEVTDNSPSNKTIFIRNVDLKLNNRDLINMIIKYVPRTTIRKISKVRTNAFVDFTTREAAETALKLMQGASAGATKFFIEWAKPSAQQSLHRMRNTDFDAKLRLKCIANNWSIPIIVFGTYFYTEQLQYGAVLLRNANSPPRFIIICLRCNELVDIHSRLCEMVVTLIEQVGDFPDCNYVFFVEKDLAHMLGVVAFPDMLFVPANGCPQNLLLDLQEVYDLSWSCFNLSHWPEEMLIQLYETSFASDLKIPLLPGSVPTNRIFMSIMPKYRNKPPLKYNLNDTQIVLALCYQNTNTNTSEKLYAPVDVANCIGQQSQLKYVSLTLFPLSLTQSKFATNHVLSHFVYSPGQQVIPHPMFTPGIPYAVSIKQP